MKTRTWLILVMVLVQLLYSCQATQGGAAAPPAAGGAAQPSAPILPGPGPKLPIRIEKVLEAYPLPTGCKGCDEAAKLIDTDYAIGYAFKDGEIGVVSAPLKSPVDGEKDTKIVGVAWSPMMIDKVKPPGIEPFTGSAFVAVVPNKEQGFLIGSTASGTTQYELQVSFEEVFPTFTPPPAIDNIIRASGVCFTLPYENPPFSRYCSLENNSYPAGFLLSARANYPEQHKTLQFEIKTAVNKLQEKAFLPPENKWLPPDQPCMKEVDYMNVTGELESDGALKECNPVEPGTSCQAEVIAAAFVPPTSDSGICFGVPDKWINLGIVRVAKDLELSNTILLKGWYLVKARTDGEGKILDGPIVTVDGVEEQSERGIREQQVPATFVAYINKREDQGTVSIAACTIWNTCLWKEKCRK